jgi:hypothetical protein
LEETEKLFAELNISSVSDICGISAQDNITPLLFMKDLSL